ncbi:SDR family NAD(P)-dependent oxidoreductase [Aspergillus mulundensis]|uniref:Short-chain dehydrogenase SDR n=1 Tax=Aspergillus mulundensis TaxID=1810919 RepID=A0A3D8SJG2_9EURO|nr:Short-chain dehydrogenase SDR [Aspergillus mulundensis]RDW86412.1 Short-chain dehydrogenase SDR [Aspergillus mulundensis]
MAQSFEGKKVLITGAGSGIGRATAKTLDGLGATLILCDISTDFLEQVKTDLEESGSSQPKHVYQKCDVSSPADCEAVVKSIPTSTGAEPKLDCLFNCAGINPTNIPITETTDSYFTRLMEVNVRGTFNMSRACVPLLSGQSSIVNVASNCGLRGYSGYTVYCATKHAIVGFTKALALELGPRGIRVNAVAPGYTDTPTMAGNVEGGDANQRLISGLALGRLGQPSEVADVVAFLFSPQSSYMTGSVVEVTGGLK